MHMLAPTPLYPLYASSLYYPERFILRSPWLAMHAQGRVNLFSSFKANHNAAGLGLWAYAVYEV